MEWPQIQTTITDGNAISTVVDAPWVSVTSVNGMTGDVIVEPVIKPFQSNHYYLKDSAIAHNGCICFAKRTFTSGGSFNANDWDVLDFAQEQADWNENDSTAESYIKNKPTIPTVNNGRLTIQKNGAQVTTFDANQSGNTTANIVTNELVTKADMRSSMLPSTVANGNKSSTYFTSMNALDSQTFGGGYADALLLSTWSDASGGRVNALVVTKQDDQKLYHYTGDYNGSTWSGKKELAYADEYLPLTGGTLTGNVGINALNTSSTSINIKHPTTNTELFFGVGAGGVNHGIWSTTLNKWMIYGDATNVYLNGNAATATSATSAGKLTTPRTIGIGTGGTGTATSFNGTANITIPLTDVKDSYVTWGGKSLAANVTPDDMGCIDEFGHNKLAFLPAECITVEYTTDGGTTWTDYGATDAQKVMMVSTTGTSFMAGGPSAVPTADNIADFKVRVRVASMTPSGTSKLYSAMVKCLLNITTNGASGTKVAIRSRTVANYKAGVDTWVNRGEFDIGGWSGWNSIPFNYTFGGTSDSQLAQFEFVLWGTGKHANYNSKVAVIDIRMIGRTNWTMPSELARAGHLYMMDTDQNATFPAKVTAPKITAPKIETGTGANNYFQSQKFRGQGDASSYYHAIDFGYGGHNQVDFYEYGGVWNFWRNTSSTATTDTANLALGIGIDALKNKSYTYTFPNKTGTFALTSDIPSALTINNGTLTIQKNATTIDTFTANSATNKTVNIVVPTDTGDLTNNAGYLKASDIYPVGSIVTFYDTVDHSSFLGLTWTRFAAGKMVVGYDSSDTDFDTIGNTGGVKTVTLTVDQIPSHRHSATSAGSRGKSQADTSGSSGYAWNSDGGYTGYSGGGQAHNNMPPYITAALWRRIA